ncbi:MAG: DUF4956 domain-containing protein [Gammaproteobacteria bacterium]|jgi:hypothetical protein|nr:DUF4956 domain-containing protein [Gammaproteobacteria bacterium]
MNEESPINSMISQHRQLLLRMMLRITVYYVILGSALALAAAVAPGFVDQLPLGGVGEIADFGSSNIYDLEEALLSADDEQIEDIVSENTRARLARGPAWLLEAMSLIYAMTSTLLLMLPVSWVYRAIHDGSVYDHSIDTTTLVLPAVVAGIVTVVQHSLALAFSLAGIVAGVRFRRALSDTFDTLFILASIGVGISAGVKSIEIAVVITVFFNYASLGVCTFGDGLLESQYEARSKIRRKSAKAAKAREKEARDDPIRPMSEL